MKGIKQTPWSEEEVAQLMRVYREVSKGRKYRFWAEIMARMPGRTESQCRSKINYQLHGAEHRARFIRDIDYPPTVPSVRVPAEVLADAQRRYRLSRPTLTAEFFGDPLPGYSALDRRQ